MKLVLDQWRFVTALQISHLSINLQRCKNFLNKNIKGYSIKGQTINIPIKNSSFKNQSVIISLTTNKILCYEIHETSINSDIYYNFITPLEIYTQMRDL
jgi:hypothetical protein